MNRKQDTGPDLLRAQRQRTERKDDLMFILKSSGIERGQLDTLFSWNNVAADRFYPDAKVVEMIRDICRKARFRASFTERQALRRAILLYCSRTLYNQMVEPLGREEDVCDVVSLFQDSKKEEAEADSAIAVSLQAPCPSNDERAAREVEEAVVATEKLASGLRARMQRAHLGAFHRPTTPRASQ